MGFFGVYPQKISEISALPVPAPSPKIFKTCPRPHPVPRLLENPRGPLGIGGTVPLTSDDIIVVVMLKFRQILVVSYLFHPANLENDIFKIITKSTLL